MALMLSFGKYGGFYWHKGYSKRLCLGWIAITLIPKDIDDILSKLERGNDGNE